MDTKKVLVTGIGGNVGQGIMRNIRSLKYPISIVGCNVSSFSAGNHLCDMFYQVPYSFDESYIGSIEAIVKNERIDLIIPSTDYEVYYLSKFNKKISCAIAVSDVKTAEVYLDKYKTFHFYKDNGIPFAKSYLPSEYHDEFKEIIIKPREGRGSRDIHVNPMSLDGFSDEYVIQELIRGDEITTAFYVNQKNELHGFINQQRRLENGTTIECRVSREFDDLLEPILIKILEYSNIKGSANLQSIVTTNGEVIPFEVNCRISGTNSIRSNFGFEDVKYTLEEYLYKSPLSMPKIIDGVAIRILMDIIYPNQNSTTSLRDKSTEHFIF